jgi:hypothetical protein
VRYLTAGALLSPRTTTRISKPTDNEKRAPPGLSSLTETRFVGFSWWGTDEMR